MRTEQNRTVLIIISIILVLVSYVWGIASYKYKLFPFPVLRDIKIHLLHQENDRRSTFSDTSIKTRVVCEDVVDKKTMVALVFGQSNSANHGGAKYESKQEVFNFFEGSCYKASDPLLGATGSDGNPWSRFGDKVIANNLYERVLLVPIAFGGSEIKRWDVGGDLHHRIADVIKYLKAKNIEVTHMLWHQGETDAKLRTSKKEYKERFLSMLLKIREYGAEAPIYVAVATRCAGRGVSLEIQSAQSELVNLKKRIYAVPNTDNIDLVGDRNDGCHFSEIGLDKHADKWLKSIQ